MNQSINWYPGHMKKATDQLVKIIDHIDLLIEVVDARCIHSSSNNELLNIFKNKPMIKVALKADLCDLSSVQNAILIDTKNSSYRKILIDHLYGIMQEKINSFKKKGLINPQFTIAVVGLPNIGKSTLINFLANKKTLVAQNKAGVTKKQTMRKINDNFYLIDTPGVFLKKIDNKELSYKLALINTINKNILPLSAINTFYHNFMIKNYWKQYAKYFDLKNKLTYNDFLNHIASIKNFKSMHNQLDINKCEDYLYNIYANGLICRYHFEE